MKEVFTKENIRIKLTAALAEGRILTYYQPQYDALTEKISGAEALVRWKSVTGEILPPVQFIPLLEHNGDVTRLDWYVLGSACRFLHDRRAAGLTVVPIAVNFSRVHIHEKDFVQRLVRCVDSLGLPHSLIHAEITESALAGEPEETVAFIKAIRDAGFSVAIDDFGSGLSSLNFVKDVPANILKIDKSLLDHNCENEKERIVLESIFDFSHRLGMSVVTEGVETKEQLGFLRTCGCETIQGYYFAKPMPRDEFAARLTAEPVCEASDTAGDILFSQSDATAAQLLLSVVFRIYPLVLMANLTRNSYYMMTNENFSSTTCPSAGLYTEGIAHGASTMHPEDRELFAKTFDREDMLRAHREGEMQRSVVTRQKGDDDVYRRIESTIYYLRSPASKDVLGISLSREV